MPRVRHENSIDNVPLHMSARGDPVGRGRRRERRRGEDENEGDERRETGERRGERRGTRGREMFVGDAITAPWDAYPGDLCASRAGSPFVPPRPLSRSSTSWPPSPPLFRKS